MATVNDIDIHVGSRLRELRLAAGWPESSFAEMLEMPVEVLRAHEAGIVRIRAMTLFKAAVLLKTHVTSFYQGLTQRLRLVVSEPAVRPLM